MSFKVSFSTRWADFDPNNHMRHTAYNDYAAESRVRLFNKYGLSLTEFNKLNIGPVLFREETNFLKEIALGDDITVEVFLKGSSERGERFKFKHKIYRGDGKLAAEIEIFAAWMDLKIRKLTGPPKIIMDVFAQLDKTDDYENIPLKAT
jgi:acyl-CoA thioester hydrolase